MFARERQSREWGLRRMKREALTHPKLFHLMSLLDCGRPAALGYLELLWDFTADHATAGDIGKWPNGALARACEWQGNPDAFVDGLRESGWLDADARYRLIVHDWAQHCQRWVKAKLEHMKVAFVGAAIAPTTEPTTVATSPRDLNLNLNLPSTNPTQTTMGHAHGPPANYPPEFEHCWREYPKRAGNNPKRKAFRAWHAQTQRGVDPGDLGRAVTRYHEWCTRTGKVNTETVMQAATFFGPDNPWEQAWKPPTTGPPCKSAAGEYAKNLRIIGAANGQRQHRT